MRKVSMEWLKWEMNLRMQVILTWTVMTLTCFIGLVEILPVIQIYESIHLTYLLVLVSLLLLIACDYCFLRIVFHFEAWKSIERELPSKFRKRMFKGRSIPLKIFFREEKENSEFKGLRNALIYTALAIWSTIWVAIILLKAFA